MSRLSRTAVLLSVLLLSSCGSIQTGRDFDVHAFETRVERGTTTQSQIRAWLGEPMSIGVSVDEEGARSDEWTYYFASGKLPDMSGARMKLLQIRFDRHGAVRSYDWSASTP